MPLSSKLAMETVTPATLMGVSCGPTVKNGAALKSADGKSMVGLQKS